MAHLLIIDDDEFFRPMLRETLEAMGHSVTEARNGAQGLVLFASGVHDLVLTDLIMPEKEGIETILELRQREPELPIIAMSGGGRTLSDNYLHMASKVGANLMLAKPFTRDILASALEAAMEGRGGNRKVSPGGADGASSLA